MTPEQALADNEKYKVVWQVLQALRAHDDRFDAMINKIDLNQGAATTRSSIIGVGDGAHGERDSEGRRGTQQALHVQRLREPR